MSNFITYHKDLFNSQFLFESKENWPWINASVEKYKRPIKWNLKNISRHYISTSIYSSCLLVYDWPDSFYNTIRILLYACWRNNFFTCKKDSNLKLPPNIKLILELNLSEQIRSKKLYSLISYQGIFTFQSNFFSVLGGAYSALGRYNKEYAIKAKKFARNQIKLAKKLQDPELECKCWIYYSEGLIQLGNFKKAKMILEQQKTFVTNGLLGDQLVMSMCENAIMKLNAAVTKKSF
ncbi:16807_t:CDS:2 [Dentiscutata erythropus]|uniref:16807_t:CDS:1 n=1 Tax=Dentiscutata erythropus TaxID=1348616 RepID=A0A9N9D1W9_9GLOM|nr:16807_t:CDS:2 [Dentiscutata erythropus]